MNNANQPERILLAHNFYREKGGEDAVYLNEKSLLESRGASVICYEKHNRDIPDGGRAALLSHALSMSWNRNTYREVCELIKRHKPQVAHFHNTFQLISPSAYAACQDNNVPVVQTLHNYRLLCPGGLLQREGQPCEQCVGNPPIPAVIHRCYRNSAFASAAVGWMLVANRNRGSFSRNVNRYIALTNFAAERFRAGKLPASRITVKPNFLPNPPSPGIGSGGYAVFVGRLSQEKGISTLLKAWTSLGNIPLIIAGDGPMAGDVSSARDSSHGNIQWPGYLQRAELVEVIRKARLLVIPSECYEGFPMTVLEAYACGTPVVASRLGSLDEVVVEGETGFKFTAGDANDLAGTVLRVWNNPDRLQGMRKNIRMHFDQHYTADINFDILQSVYASAIMDHAS